ncbi:MAG: hypothetical protein FWD88_03510 [Treponema sp.]|nr:hypothetical protein [Treponema sp.]
MQAYEGYFQGGRFYTVGVPVRIPEHRRIILTVLDEPVRDENTAHRLAAIDRFLTAIDASDEEVPDFERVNFGDVEI